MSPVRVLDALVASLRRVAGSYGRELRRVELHLSPPAESRADRFALGRCDFGVPVEVHVAGHGKNMADVAIAIAIADAWHRRPDRGLLVVSGDADLAFAAAHYAAMEPGGRPVELLHPGPVAPAAPGGRRLATRPLGLRLEPGLARRPWTGWDQAAWTLRQLAAPAGQRAVAGRLEDWEAFWPATRELALFDWVRLERIDDVLTALWRRREGQPLAWTEALAETALRLSAPAGGTGPGAGSDARAALAALWTAGLLRDTGAGALEVPSSWREGLLLPMRRLVLFLGRRRPPVAPVSRLRQLHRRRFYRARRPGEATRALERYSSADSWAWVNHALRKRLGAVAEETGRRDGDADAVALWHLLLKGDFVTQTLLTARTVRAALARPATTSEAVARLGGHGVTAPKRWLRCMDDAGLLGYDRASGTWKVREDDTPFW